MLTCLLTWVIGCGCWSVTNKLKVAETQKLLPSAVNHHLWHHHSGSNWNFILLNCQQTCCQSGPPCYRERLSHVSWQRRGVKDQLLHTHEKNMCHLWCHIWCHLWHNEGAEKEEGGSILGEGSLAVSTQTAALSTQPKQKKRDGWMDDRWIDR